MKLGKLLLILVAAVVLGYGGTKFYLHHEVESRLDRQIHKLRPFADISYEGVSSNLLDGSLAVENIRIAPKGEIEALSIARVDVTGDGPGFLWDLVAGEFGPQPPQQLQVSFSELAVPLDWYFSSQSNAWMGEVEYTPPEPCTLAGIFQDVGLEELGFRQLVADGHIQYKLSQWNGNVTFVVDYTLKGIETGRLEIGMAGFSFDAPAMMQSLPTLSHMNFRYQLDAAHSEAMLAYCALQHKQTPEQFLDNLFALNDAGYAEQLGFVPGPGLRGMMRQVLAGPAELLISINPGSNLDFTSLGLYKPEQLVDLLGVQVQVDGQDVTDLSYQLSATSKQLLAKLADKHGKDDASAPATPAKKEKIEERYLPTSIASLKRLVGKKVKIHTDQGGRPREGVLVSFDNDVASVEQRLHGGRVVMHTQLENIQKVEILTTVKVE